MSDLDQIRREERRVASQIEHLARPAIDLFEEACEWYLSIFSLAAETASGGDKEQALLGLYARMFNNLWTGFQVLRCGFYYQHLIVFRSVLEDLLMARYLRSYPEKASAWLEGKQFRPGEVRKALAAVEDIEPEGLVAFKKTYSALSAIAHSNINGVDIFEEPKRHSKDRWVVVGPSFDRYWVRVGCTNSILMVIEGLNEMISGYSDTLPLTTEADEVVNILMRKLLKLPWSCSGIRIDKDSGKIQIR